MGFCDYGDEHLGYIKAGHILISYCNMGFLLHQCVILFLLLCCSLFVGLKPDITWLSLMHCNVKHGQRRIAIASVGGWAQPLQE